MAHRGALSCALIALLALLLHPLPAYSHVHHHHHGSHVHEHGEDHGTAHSHDSHGSAEKVGHRHADHTGGGHEGSPLQHTSPAEEGLNYQKPTWVANALAGLSSSRTGLWLMAMGSSLAVSLASLICLALLPFILREGSSPSPLVIQTLTAFGAGAMVGDAFLHQLPHAFGGAAHSHDHSGHGHEHNHAHEESHSDDRGGGHAHSLADLTVGISVLAGLLVFFLVEKAVRYVEEANSGTQAHSHSHHHHHHHHQGAKKPAVQVALKKGEQGAGVTKGGSQGKNEGEQLLNKAGEKPAAVQSLAVLGYLNLFSDGVHNFTDGMALGAAFLHHGAIGGWSRTLFMLAHELPQEVGDFGILLRAGFSAFQALAWNFASATMALAGTALALLAGGDASNSAIIEGFTAGGFIYIAVAGVMPDMHAQGCHAGITTRQVISLMAGMGIALGISLWE